MSIRRADTVTALCLAALGLVVVGEGLRLGIGWSTSGPRSGFFPFWLGVIFAASSLVVLLQTRLRHAPKMAAAFVGPGQLAPVLLVLLPAVGMVALVHILGMYLAGAIYIGVYMRWIGRHTWRAVLVTAVAVPVVTFFAFEQLFLVPLPKGPIETLLGY